MPACQSSGRNVSPPDWATATPMAAHNTTALNAFVPNPARDSRVLCIGPYR